MLLVPLQKMYLSKSQMWLNIEYFSLIAFGGAHYTVSIENILHDIIIDELFPPQKLSLPLSHGGNIASLVATLSLLL